MTSKTPEAAGAIAEFLKQRMERAAARPLITGLAGAQGSGKTTIAAAIEKRFKNEGLDVARLSLDDLYLGRSERLRLAKEIHPLFTTRGPPGTHDVRLGVNVLAVLKTGNPVLIPRFDKAADAHRVSDDEPRIEGRTDLVIFEGWCVGARAQSDDALIEPVNMLERAFDENGQWRRYANNQLKTRYTRLFAFLDCLVFIAAPSFGVVKKWRTEQEHELAQRRAAGAGLMQDDEIAWFIQHYERITRRMLAETPSFADATVRLGQERSVIDIIRKNEGD